MAAETNKRRMLAWVLNWDGFVYGKTMAGWESGEGRAWGILIPLVICINLIVCIWKMILPGTFRSLYIWQEKIGLPVMAWKGFYRPYHYAESLSCGEDSLSVYWHLPIFPLHVSLCTFSWYMWSFPSYMFASTSLLYRGFLYLLFFRRHRRDGGNMRVFALAVPPCGDVDRMCGQLPVRGQWVDVG